METDNVRKQLKKNQIIWKMLWCIGNFIYLRSFVLELHQKPKSIFSKSDFA